MILDEIVENTRQELRVHKHMLPAEKLERLARSEPLPLDFKAALRGDGVKLIAEVKKASPSCGVIREDFDPVQVAATYVENGAAAISVLTESRYFQGSLSCLSEIKKSLGARVPLLRKDFIIDPYQVYESRVYGADALLLIVAVLTPSELESLLVLSRRLGLSCLVEVHDEAQLETALRSGAEIIGINNRDLTTFRVDMGVTERLCPLVPPDRLVVSESGIKTRGDIEKLRTWGVNAALVGESLVAVPDIASAVRELLP